MTVHLRGRRVAIDRRAPFFVRISRSRLRRSGANRLVVGVARRGAPALRLTTRLRRC